MNRTMLVAAVLAAMLTSCDSHDNSQSVSVTNTSSAIATGQQPDDVGEQALTACTDADNQASDDWIRVIKHKQVEGDFSEGKFHDDLQSMVNNCRPILPAFETQQADLGRAKAAKECQEGFRLKIQAYQDMLDGVADTQTANSLIQGGNLISLCNQYAEQHKATTD